MDIFNYLLAKKGKSININDDLFGYLLGKNSGETIDILGEGTNITLDDTIRSKMKLDLLGNTYQETTSTSGGDEYDSPSPDHPQPIQVVSGDNSVVVCGKNLYGGFSYSRNNNGISYTYNEDGTMTANGTATATSYSMASSQASDYLITLKAGTYTLSGGTSDIQIDIVRASGSTIASTPLSSPYTKTFTLNEGGDVFVRLHIASGVSVDNVKIYQMLEEGTTVSTYEPYTGTTYPINLGVENLFDGDYYKSLDTWTKFYTNYFAYVELPSSFKTKLTCSMNLKGTSQPYVFGLLDNLDNVGGTTWRVLSNGTINTRHYDYTNSNNVYLIIGNPSHITQDYSEIDKIVDNYNIMLNLGEEEKPYTPYGADLIELCKIGTYQDKFIRNKGKNYYDSSKLNHFAFASHGNDNILSKAVNYIGYAIPCNEGEVYSISRLSTTNTRFRVMFSSEEPAQNVSIFGGTGNLSTYDNALKIENIVVPSGAKYLNIYLSNASETIPPIMINEGTTALPYEPYGNGDWYLKKEIGEVVLDKDWNWQTQATTNYQVTLSGDNKIYLATSGIGISDYFRVGTSGTDIFLYPILQTGTDYIRLSNATSKWASVTDLKTFLTNNNVEFKYPLSTPTYTKIEGTLASQLETVYKAKSYKNQTNISQINNDLPFYMKVIAKGKINA